MSRVPLSADPLILRDPSKLSRIMSELNKQLDELYRERMSQEGGTSFADHNATLPPVANINFTGDSVSITFAGNAIDVAINTIAHALLGPKHSDTLTGTVVRGDIIRGNSTPKWSRLALGASGLVLKSDGTDAGWGVVTQLETTTGPTTLTVGAVADGEFLKRSGTGLISAPPPYAAWPMNYALVTDLTVVGGSTDQRLLEFVFDGTDDYPAGLTDLLMVDAETSGTGSTTVFIRDITNSLTIATKTFTDANARAVFDESTFANLPTGRARMQLRATVGASATLVIGAAKWRRRRA